MRTFKRRGAQRPVERPVEVERLIDPSAWIARPRYDALGRLVISVPDLDELDVDLAVDELDPYAIVDAQRRERNAPK